ETYGTETVDPAKIAKAVNEVFDLRPAAIVRDLDLRRPIYKRTAAYGHFGRNDKELTWEQTTKVDDLKSALGLSAPSRRSSTSRPASRSSASCPTSRPSARPSTTWSPTRSGTRCASATGCGSRSAGGGWAAGWSRSESSRRPGWRC